MGVMNIVTGRTGKKHVRAIDDARIYRALLGGSDFILTEGNTFSASLTTTQYGAPAIAIQDGYLIMQGRLCGFDGTAGQEVLPIDLSNMTGYQRIDYVVAHYYITADPDNPAYSIEHCDLEVIQGNRSASNPVAPELRDGDIDSGEDRDFLLWQVNLDSMSIDSVVDRRNIINMSGLQMFTDWTQMMMDEFDAFMRSFHVAQSRVIYSKTVPFSGSNVLSITFSGLSNGFNNPYTWSSNDIKELYINGLKIASDEVSFSRGENDSVIATLSTPIANAFIEEAELIIF